MSKIKNIDELNNMLNDNMQSNLLFRFAFFGNKDEQTSRFSSLAAMTEKEIWSTNSTTNDYDILINYITYTFEKAFYDCKLLFSDKEDYCCFNTGLLTENGEDIICLFNLFKNSNKFKWHFNSFEKESSRLFMSNFDKTPDVISYFDDPSALYFDPYKEFVKNLDHILDDNKSRIPEELTNKGNNYVSFLLNSSLDKTIKRCKRNYRIAVPCYYNKNITYLLPINLDGTDMAVAIELLNGRYRVNTIFTLEMAYKLARLLMKPEADWLNIK